jgi:hypothetical protein
LVVGHVNTDRACEWQLGGQSINKRLGRADTRTCVFIPSILNDIPDPLCSPSANERCIASCMYSVGFLCRVRATKIGDSDGISNGVDSRARRGNAAYQNTPTDHVTYIIYSRCSATTSTASDCGRASTDFRLARSLRGQRRADQAALSTACVTRRCIDGHADNEDDETVNGRSG